MVARSGRLFGWYLVWSREGSSVDDGYELVLCPGVFVVVEALPERSQSSLDLACVRFEVKLAKRTYLQLPHNRLAIVFRPSVYAQSD